ncbi:MAG: tRNA (N6-isopentenyl adenosine(37)-C2)-methylthiotransferase MiaB [Candidatus Methylacidiphilales bacterium]
MPSFHIKTYGCQMNERDSEQVSRQLRERGYVWTARPEEADVVLLNTCSVRDMAEQKAIHKMGQLQNGLKKKNRNLVLGFMGCMAQSRGEELTRLLPGVDLVVGTQKYHRVAEYVDRLLGRIPGHMDDLRTTIVDVGEEEGSQNTIRDHEVKERQATAFVSIMQGCNMKCTFCIVPYTRGGERSRPIIDIVAETRELVSRGVKEVTLLGQIVNLYGRHEFPSQDGKSPFVQLLYALEDIEGLERIRFTSPHPIGYKKDLVHAFRELKKLCEHVHLPLQSGSNRILKAMHRAYTAERYRSLVAEMRNACPDIAITTDIIVGFPGETEQDYLETRQLVEEVAFDNAFIFRYSKRKDTPASELADQISEDVKEFRNKDLLGVIDRIAEAKLGDMVGRTVEVLVEGPSKTNAARWSGRTRQNKLVILEGPERLRGQLVPVRIVESTGFTFYGDPVLHEGDEEKEMAGAAVAEGISL